MQTHEIRKRFTDYFVNAGHAEVPSAPLVLEDPTLLFVNAGMVPFKPYFLGQQSAPFATATSIQNCVRTLDIDEVGITTRHNTYFQMAGNFSFGNYFKEGAIHHAWTLLTSLVDEGGYGLPADRLWATIYEDDDEAFTLWRDVVGMPEDHIQRRGMKDNFWSMGVPGPCGPSSEIYYDRGPAYGKEGGPVVDEDRFIEIWNLVFMQNERGEGVGKDGFDIVGVLPQKNIDTGMGVERVACILQGVENVYETDLLQPTIATAERLTGRRYSDEAADSVPAVYFRIIADHARTAVMLIGDGVVPGNEGRGYILRRLIRRTIRSAWLLGADGAVMPDLVETVCTSMRASFPYLADKQDHIDKVCAAEERAFLRTLETGTKLFSAAVARLGKENATVIPGDVAFTLHDTHGFPIDLTREMAREKGMTVGDEAFVRLMDEQKQRAKADSTRKKHGHADLSLYRTCIDQHPTRFVGYDTDNVATHLVTLFVDGAEVEQAEVGQQVEIVLDESPFYAEGGGQGGDRGTITSKDGEVAVTDVQKLAKCLWIHKGTVTAGTIHLGPVEAEVDAKWRRQAKQAHTATHLVHAALRAVLGEDAVQAGSMNRPGYFRFDFSWGDQLSAATLAEIEERVNMIIDQDLPVSTEIMTIDEARERGAVALFGENYGDAVRVVTVGGSGQRMASKEVCGGTHVTHTSQIGSLRIIGESSVGSGTRRIEALVGLRAADAARADQALVRGLSEKFKAKPGEILTRVDALQQQLKGAEKQISDMRAAAVVAAAAALVNQSVDVSGVSVVAGYAPQGTSGAELRSLAGHISDSHSDKPLTVVLFAPQQQKVPFVVAATPAAVSRGIKAGALVSALAPLVGGRGGGKADMAQGSGTTVEMVDDAIAEVPRIVAESINHDD